MKKKKQDNDLASQTNASIENEFDSKVKDKMGAMIKNLKDNKEAYVLICTALGLVFSAIWNIACGLGYKGYADGLNIGIEFIQKDNQNILISLIIFLGVAVLGFPIYYAIYKLAKLVYMKKFVRRLFIFIAAILFISPIAFPLLNTVFPSAETILYYAFIVSVLLSIASLVFLIIYIPILSVLVDMKGNPSNTQNKNVDNKQDEEHKPVSKFALWIKAIATFLVALFTLLLAIYLFGLFTASSRLNYEFIVDDFSFTYDGSTVYENVILSETDDIYYLAACTISGSADNATITIYPYYYTIVKKNDEPVKVVKMRFHAANIVRGKYPNISNNDYSSSSSSSYSSSSNSE